MLVHVIIDDVEVATVTADSNGNWTYVPDDLSNGDHKFAANVQDVEGNRTDALPKTITIKATYTLKGKVTDKTSGTSLPGAIVKLYDLKNNLLVPTTTDENGDYQITITAENQYKLFISAAAHSDTWHPVEVIIENIDHGVMTENISLTKFSLLLTAKPSSIVGDGTDTTNLKAEIRNEKGDLLPGVNVTFAAPHGHFDQGTTATTDAQGIASLLYRSEQVDATKTVVIPVTITVDNEPYDLHGQAQIFITFEPGAIMGTVIDNATHLPVAGAIVKVSKDFDGDGIIDFYYEAVTESDGKYKIAIPRGNMTYDISTTMKVAVGDSEQEVTFTQKATSGVVTGNNVEEYESTKTATGVIVMKDAQGQEQMVDEANSSTLNIGNLKLDIFDQTDLQHSTNLSQKRTGVVKWSIYSFWIRPCEDV